MDGKVGGDLALVLGGEVGHLLGLNFGEGLGATVGLGARVRRGALLAESRVPAKMGKIIQLI